MLKLDAITKIYPLPGNNDVQALKGVTINFRANEFVAILGPSGCGKTTLLNIVGGLDHYTDGDLIIGGRSTKEFKSHDWDVYRNHEIGFVFQSYNLIPHQNILQNVALALTIAGVSKKEREERAKAALDKVGLQGLYKKMPNQLSGGQCQRVAIARALVNEPSILLADEPTGALDSVTSIQIMDLIAEIAKEKLVIMVTHNPELADRYATRVVNLHDGEVVGDSNPYTDEEESLERSEAAQPAPKKDKAKMSLPTAFRLSATNLWTKRKRTALVVIASSVGIVGTSAVLAVSNGVKGYINSIQDDFISGNPIEVSESSFDLASIISSLSGDVKSSAVLKGVHDGVVDVDFIIKQLVDQADAAQNAAITNTLTEEYMAYIDQMPSEYISAISKRYGINAKNNVYTDVTVDALDDDGNPIEKVRQYSLSALINVCGEIVKQTEYGTFATQIEGYAGTFSQIIDSESYISRQYDFVAGHYPQKEDELLLVLNNDGTMDDFVLTGLGFYSQSNFLNAIYKFTEDEVYFDAERWENQQAIPFENFLNKEFHYYPNDTIFRDTHLGDANPFYYYPEVKSDWGDGMVLKIAGIAKAKESINYGCLSDGIYYTEAFTRRFIADNIVSKLYQFLDSKDEKAFSSSVVVSGGAPIATGITYSVDVVYQGEPHENIVPFGSRGSGLSALIGAFSGGSSIDAATISARQSGGGQFPSTIEFYPRDLNYKDKVTSYLGAWNGDGDLTVGDTVIKAADRNEIKYTDNLSLILTMINSMIDIVTVSLIIFTSLSLVVSVVMIAVITYVSVMERIKEIGVIRAMGGRKTDVSNLFNAETAVIGFLSGLFGVLVTYLLEAFVNIIIKAILGISMIVDLSPVTALIVILVSIALTAISGLVPASSAARKDPVVALRTE